MNLLQWIKEHLELLTIGGASVAGGVKVLNTQAQHEEKISKLENYQEIVREDLSEIKGDIKTLLERTKHL